MSTMLRFAVEETAWLATWGTTGVYETCPHCLGDGRIRLIFADGTEVSVGCQNCPGGYEPPTGQVLVWKFQARAERVTITGFEVEGGTVTWKAHGAGRDYYLLDDDKIFSTREEAERVAREQAALHEAQERDRVLKKEKDTRSWSWHATYHRKRIKDAEHDLEYHRAALAVASLKAREDKK